MAKIVQFLFFVNIGMQGVIFYVFEHTKKIAALYLGQGPCQMWFFGHILLLILWSMQNGQNYDYIFFGHM